MENVSRSPRYVEERNAREQIGRERWERELTADFQLPIVDLIRATASSQPLDGFLMSLDGLVFSVNCLFRRFYNSIL